MYTRKFNYLKQQSFFLFGPRGVGKSSWLENQFSPPKQIIDLLEPRTFNRLTADPSRLIEMIYDSKNWIIIDEIQKIPKLLDEVHRLIERKKIRFVLTGSSARSLRKAGVNLLAGRALTEYLYPLTASELADDFNFDKSIAHGHLPMAYTGQNPEEYLQSYVKTYIKEEVIQEGIVRNLMGFSRFLEAASFSQGQYLNVTKVASDCMVDRKVTEEYFRVLEDLLITERLSHFKKRATRKSDAHPKFFFFDVGVYRALRPKGPMDFPEEIEGPAIETLVYQEIRAHIAYSSLKFKIYCWKGVNDVDFVLYGESGLVAIEVKRSSRLRGGEFDGLLEFKKHYAMARLIFLYGGDTRKMSNDIEAINLVDFLRRIQHFLGP